MEYKKKLLNINGFLVNLNIEYLYLITNYYFVTNKQHNIKIERN